MACTPYQSSCDGGVERVCRPDGSGFDENECDPVQGMACDAAGERCAGVCSLAALGASYVGCEYYPTITENPGIWGDFTFGVIVANFGTTPANVRLERANGDAPELFVVGAREVATKRLPLVKGTVYRLRSDQPIIAYQFNPLEYVVMSQFEWEDYSYTNDASLLLPRNALGRDYVVAGWPLHEGEEGWAGGLVAVTAAQDDTLLTITTSAAGESYSRTLQRGELFYLANGGLSGAIAADLTGARVVADKPVQVISGHMCATIPIDVPYCDHLEEVLFPVNSLGKTYVTSSPQALASPAPYLVRVVAVEDDTRVSYAPAMAGASTVIREAGAFVEFQTTEDVAITSDKPVSVAQYMLGSELVGIGDPSMALAVPIEQWRSNYLFHAPVNYPSNYVNITAPTGVAVMLDGLPVAGFTPVGGTGWSVARVALDNSGEGNHELTSTEKFGISVYGYGDYTSYWYPGGLDLAPVDVH